MKINGKNLSGAWGLYARIASKHNLHSRTDLREQRGFKRMQRLPTIFQPPNVEPRGRIFRMVFGRRWRVQNSSNRPFTGIECRVTNQSNTVTPVPRFICLATFSKILLLSLAYTLGNVSSSKIGLAYDFWPTLRRA